MSPTRIVREPARDVPVYADTEVLVVGGGPAGFAAAVSAARAGAEVTLLERYGHLGGLATGGLVIWIEVMSDPEGVKVIRGVVDEVITRLDELNGVMHPPRHLVGNREPRNVAYWGERMAAKWDQVVWAATVEPELMKYICNDMAEKVGVNLILHSWGTGALTDGNRVTGITFESKEGRQAILAKQVVDATGDGDIFASAGAEFETGVIADLVHATMNIIFRFGGVDMARWRSFKESHPEEAEGLMEQVRKQGFARPAPSAREDVVWVNPRLSGLDPLKVADLTRCEIECRKIMIRCLDFYRKNVPGFESAWILDTSSQIGTRCSRRLLGTHRLTVEEVAAGTRFDDVVGMAPSFDDGLPNVYLPYGTLVPRAVDGVLAAGRCISTDARCQEPLRLIPQAFMSGQAAGVAAAVAAGQGVQPRAVNIKRVQDILHEQGAYLGADPIPAR